ncbi:MAG: hypothetical protein RIF34_00120, partial [Candidatus Kapaibacterium sp.]
LRESLTDVESGKWDNQVVEKMQKFIEAIESNEVELLSNKKKRAFNLLTELLKYWKAKEQDNYRKELFGVLSSELIIKKHSDEIIDLQGFLDTWIEIVQPRLTEYRSKHRTPKVITDLKASLKKHPISTNELERLVNSIEFTERIGNRIVACIIGVSK